MEYLFDFFATKFGARMLSYLILFTFSFIIPFAIIVFTFTCPLFTPKTSMIFLKNNEMLIILAGSFFGFFVCGALLYSVFGKFKSVPIVLFVCIIVGSHVGTLIAVSKIKSALIKSISIQKTN